MATTSLNPPPTAAAVELEHEQRVADPAAPRRPRRRRRKNAFAWALIAPALTFMVLIHLVPTLAGGYLPFLRLNTFTLPQLFGAPWAGLENYRSILFDTANPLHDG